MSDIKELSQKSKASILAGIKNAYKNTHFTYHQSEDPLDHIQSNGDILSQMKQKMSDNKYIVEEASKENLEEKINEIILQYNCKKMIHGTGLSLDLDKINAEEKICFNKEIENLRHDVFHSDFSIIHARAGVSSHGVALVVSSKEQPRMLSLAPKLCIILLKKENVVQSISQAFNLIKKENAVLPSNILFIAGPSRTADIELITVFGVHGPQMVHIIIY